VIDLEDTLFVKRTKKKGLKECSGKYSWSQYFFFAPNFVLTGHWILIGRSLFVVAQKLSRCGGGEGRIVGSL